MDKQRTNTLKTVLNLLIAVTILAVVVFLLFLGPAFVSSSIPVNSYIVTITDLSGLAVNGTVTVMVPIPVNVDGVPAISEEAFTRNRQPPGWRTEVRETSYGKMLAFTTTDDCAPDISAPFSELEMKGEPRVLAPVLAMPERMSIAEFTRAPEGTYTTVVFLDGFVPPENATSISFDLRYQGGGGKRHLVREDTRTATVNAAFSGTESGFIPVPANYYVVAGGFEL
jgi:hypothetical protein